jgi:hypothetical protein
MAINQSLLARNAVQGACWAFAWRVFVFLAVVQVPFLLARSFAPDFAVHAYVAMYVATGWLIVRIVLPTWIRLRRHYWRVHDFSVPAEPALAHAIVTDQWGYLKSDLTLPWRAIRG